MYSTEVFDRISNTKHLSALFQDSLKLQVTAWLKVD